MLTKIERIQHVGHFRIPNNSTNINTPTRDHSRMQYNTYTYRKIDNLTILGSRILILIPEHQHVDHSRIQENT